MREHNIEEKVCEHAEATGWLVRKMQYIGRRGCPDRFFFGPRGAFLIVEFKRTGKGADPHQSREHDRFRGRGHTVHLIDQIETGIALLDETLAAA